MALRRLAWRRSSAAGSVETSIRYSSLTIGKMIENTKTTRPRNVWPWRISTSTVVSSEYSLVQNMNLVSLRIGKLMPSARHTAAPMMAKLNRKRRPPSRMGCPSSRHARGDCSAGAAPRSLKAARAAKLGP